MSMLMMSACGEILACADSGRQCQASVVGHSLRPAAAVLCEGQKAVSRIRQSSRAGQPDTSGFNECPSGRRGVQTGTIKGERGMGDCGRTSRPQTPIWFIPPTPRGDNARERSASATVGAPNPPS